jgi:hypothetical protein
VGDNSENTSGLENGRGLKKAQNTRSEQKNKEKGDCAGANG